MSKSKSRFHSVRKSLEKHHSKAVKALNDNHSKALTVAKNHALTLFGGALMASSIAGTNVSQLPIKKKDTITQLSSGGPVENSRSGREKAKKDYEEINELLLKNPDNLTEEQEKIIENSLSSHFDLKLKVELDGNRLNTIWGYFGQEQHLYRWSGDNLSAHGEELEHGIAPATGAFGYFDNAQQEKYYIAAPIHLLPDWNTNWPTLKPWYKYRKVFIYNPENKRGIVAVIGDAGPAKWTGKQFGGSPELMAYLNMYDGSAKSKAVVLFLEEGDSDNIKLGPVIDSTGTQVSSLP